MKLKFESDGESNSFTVPKHKNHVDGWTVHLFFRRDERFLEVYHLLYVSDGSKFIDQTFDTVTECQAWVDEHQYAVAIDL